MVSLLSTLLAGFLIFSQWLSVSEIWHSSINPLRLGISAIHKLVPFASAESEIRAVLSGALERGVEPEEKMAGRPPSLANLLLGATVSGLAMSVVGVAEKGGLDFNSLSPVTVVITIAEIIEENTDPDDEIMSGEIVWSYLADRYSCMKENHSLGFYKLDVDSEIV